MPPTEVDEKIDQMDEESLAFLEQVRKGKSRNFVLSMKGNKVRSLLIKKKPIKAKDRKSARGEGYQAVFGILTGMGAKITFSVARSDGFDEKVRDCKVEKLKKFLSAQTSKAFKPTFELVDTPPPIPFDEEDLDDPLIARFMKLEPVINKACDASPDSVSQIEERTREIRGLLQEDERRADAGPKIDEFITYLKGLLAGDTAPAPTSVDEAEQTDTAVTDDPGAQAAELAGALKRLKPLVDQVIDAAPGRKGELHATMAQIAGEIKARQFDQARQNVTDFAALLKSLSAQQPVTSAADSVDRMQQFTQRRNALEPRLLEAQKADRDKAAKLGAVWDYANKQAQAGNFANAFQSLERLETAIDGLLAAGVKTETSPKEVQQPTSEDGRAAEFKRRAEDVKTKLQEFLKTTPQNADELKRTFAQAVAEAKPGGDIQSALEKLTEIENAISGKGPPHETETTSKGETAVSPEQEKAAKDADLRLFKTQAEALKPKLEEFLNSGHEDASKVKGPWDRAHSMAEEGSDIGGAIDCLDEVEATIAAAELVKREEDQPLSFVQFQMARKRWSEAKRSVLQGLNTLSKEIVSENPDDGDVAREVTSLIVPFNEEALDWMDRGLNAEDSKERLKNYGKAVPILRRLATILDSDPRIALVDENDFDVKVGMQEQLGGSVHKLLALLGAN